VVRKLKNNEIPQKKEGDYKPKTTSILSIMQKGREFESILKFDISGINLADEIVKALDLIADKRGRPIVCYMSNCISNKINASTSIDQTDDLPFMEMIDTVPENVKELDIIVVTGGGSAQQVSKFVDKLRPRFDKVSFIIPSMAMSAGTIFVMSGNEIIMNKSSYIGPIDPQVPNKQGRYVPAQSINSLIDDIRKKGEENIKNGLKPNWTDMQILSNIDPKDIGSAIGASEYSIKLVTTYLYNYKFEDWKKHSDGSDVSDKEREDKAKDIAKMLCNHSIWKSHGHGITREVAHDECMLRITKTEDLGIDEEIRKFWALIHYLFDTSNCYKIFISKNYSLFRMANQ